MKLRYSIYMLLVLWLCVACDRTEPGIETDITVSFSLPVPATKTAMYAPSRRTPGDPGTNEVFELPNYIYIFIFQYDGDNWNRTNFINLTLTEEDWKKAHYGGVLRTDGDSIYRCTQNLHILLPGSGVTGRVYAIASAIPLTFSATLNTLTNINDLLNLKIDISSSTAQNNLHNIYTTPYNYILNGKYYGTFNNDDSNVAPLELVLYHIATKVDIQWSVDPEKRINKADKDAAIRLTYMKVKNLLNTSCYVFRPMENVEPAVRSDGRSIEFVRPDDEGLWWEGRYYFYTIPYTVGATPGTHFPLQMEMSTNGSSAKYRPTLNLSIDTSSPFVPWLRAMFNIGNQLTEKAETITP